MCPVLAVAAFGCPCESWMVLAFSIDSGLDCNDGALPTTCSQTFLLHLLFDPSGFYRLGFNVSPQ